MVMTMYVLGLLLVNKINNTISYKLPDVYRVFYIKRKIEDKDLEHLNLVSMPGFQLSWYYSGADVTPKPVDNSNNRIKR